VQQVAGRIAAAAAAAAAVGGVVMGLVRCIHVVQLQEQQCEHTILLSLAALKPLGKTNLTSLRGRESVIFFVERGWVLFQLSQDFLTKTQISVV
jgi:hypothetical protein